MKWFGGKDVSWEGSVPKLGVTFTEISSGPFHHPWMLASASSSVAGLWNAMNTLLLSSAAPCEAKLHHFLVCANGGPLELYRQFIMASLLLEAWRQQEATCSSVRTRLTHWFTMIVSRVIRCVVTGTQKEYLTFPRLCWGTRKDF